MTNLLTKTVNLTAKELLIGGTTVVGVVFTITGICASIWGYKKGKKNVVKHDDRLSKKYENIIDDLKNENKKIRENMEDSQRRMVKYANLHYLAGLTKPFELHQNLSNLKITDENKVLIYNYYEQSYKNLIRYISEYCDEPYEEYEEGCLEKVGLLKTVMTTIAESNINSLNLLAKQIETDNKKKAEEEAINREQRKVRESYEHEMAMKKEETKKFDKYLEHLEEMKQMDVETQKMKTAAFAGVAKSAIDTIKKEKED